MNEPRLLPTDRISLKQAVLKAADHIEAHPDKFEFGEVDVPHTCDSPGCALGWIHYFSRIKGKPCDFYKDAQLIEAALLDPTMSDDADFYSRMDSLGIDDWRFRALGCAAALRLYAEEFCHE